MFAEQDNTGFGTFITIALSYIHIKRERERERGKSKLYIHFFKIIFKKFKL